MFGLGQAYQSGVGLERDLVMAHAWFNLAAARQHAEALASRRQIEAEMDLDQINAAQKFAREWTPTTATTPSSSEGTNGGNGSTDSSTTNE